MAEPLPEGMTEVTLSGYTASAPTVTLTIRINPRSGAIAIYLAPTDAHPAFVCDGPGRQVTIGCESGKLYVRRLNGAVDVEIRVVTWG